VGEQKCCTCPHLYYRNNGNICAIVLDSRVDSLRKDIENLCINELILKYVLMSNLTMPHRLLKELILLRYMKIGLLALRKLLPFDVKGALNPNFLNLTKNKEKFCL